MTTLKLVNLGSLCIDRVYAVASIARAGETLASSAFSIHAGGKGLNQSIAAARAGARVLHVGCIGEDGRWLESLLAGEGVATAIRVTGEASGHAVIQVTPAGANAIVIVGGANRLHDGDDRERALSACRPGDWLLLQNEINDLELVLAEAARRDIPVCLNLAPFDLRAATCPLAAVAVLIVNEIEATGLTGLDEPREALSCLQRRLPSSRIVLTRGDQGLLYATPDGCIASVPAFPIAAVDETGAGDAFIGSFLADILAGASFADALRRGSAAGALAVTKMGAATSLPMRAEVDGLLARAASRMAPDHERRLATRSLRR